MVQHAETLTRQLKSSQIIQISTARIPAKDIYNIVDKDSSMTGTGRRNGSNALQLSPFSCRNVERPCVVMVMSAIGHTTESTKKNYNEGRG